jgi:hypothetical protein
MWKLVDLSESNAGFKKMIICFIERLCIEYNMEQALDPKPDELQYDKFDKIVALFTELGSEM